MKKYLTIIIILLLTTQMYGQDYNIEWSTLISGSQDESCESIATDIDGNIYVYGYTRSSNFPTTNNAYSRSYSGGSELFLMKFSKEKELIWSTFIGGNNVEYPKNIKINKDYMWLAADTRSTNFPTTNNAFQKSNKGDYDAVIMKFSLDGKMLYSSYYGTNSYDVVDDIAIDDDENIWFTGRVYGSNLYTTNDAAQKSHKNGIDSYIAKFDKDGQAIYSSYLGGNGDDFAMDIAYNKKSKIVAITGYTKSIDFPIVGDAIFPNKIGGQSFDTFISYFNTDGKMIWSSYFGGDGADFGEHITDDKNDGFYFRFFTDSKEIVTNKNTFQKVNPGNYSSYIANVNKNGELVWGSFYGGGDRDSESNINNKGGGLSVNESNEVLISGFTNSPNLPIKGNAYQNKKNNTTDAYIAKFDELGNLLYSSYLGGNNTEEGRDVFLTNDKIYISGFTNSTDFPTTDNAISKNKLGGRDGFISVFGTSTVCSNVFDSDNGFKNIGFITNRNMNDDTKVSLTRDASFDLGYLFYGENVNIASGFTTDFSFIISEGKIKVVEEELKATQVMGGNSLPGADGIALVLVGEYPNFKGKDGGNIGYGGYRNAMAIEIDLYQNDEFNDPNGNHLAIQIHQDGYLSPKHSEGRNLFINDNIVEVVSDSTQEYHCRVEYVNQVIRVYLDSTGQFETPVAEITDFDFNEYLKLEYHSNAFIGLTSSTGKEVEMHDITHWDLCTNSGQAFTSGVEDISSEYSLYPNPTDGEFSIDFDRELNGLLDITVTDILGRVVMSNSMYSQSGRVNLNISSLIDGVYNVNISSAGELIHSAKLIKK